jgi:GTP-binding protein
VRTPIVSREDAPLLQGARHIASAATWEQLPAALLPEIAFAGRSNAGKSSAINALTARHGLAFVSRTPGRTQLINLFEVPAGFILADLPGYGFSKVPAEVRERWRDLLERYLRTRAALAGVVLVMDARHPLMPLDVQLIDWLAPAARPLHVLLTKADKLSRSQARAALDHVNRWLAARAGAGRQRLTAQLFSSTGRTGIAEAEAAIRAWVGREKERPLSQGDNSGASMP